jgi:hypothetical protein
MLENLALLPFDTLLKWLVIFGGCRVPLPLVSPMVTCPKWFSRLSRIYMVMMADPALPSLFPLF